MARSIVVKGVESPERLLDETALFLHRVVAELLDEAGELQVGETVTAEAFSEGDQVKVSGVAKGKGFQGTIKRRRAAASPARTAWSIPSVLAIRRIAAT